MTRYWLVRGGKGGEGSGGVGRGGKGGEVKIKMRRREK